MTFWCSSLRLAQKSYRAWSVHARGEKEPYKIKKKKKKRIKTQKNKRSNQSETKNGQKQQHLNDFHRSLEELYRITDKNEACSSYGVFPLWLFVMRWVFCCWWLINPCLLKWQTPNTQQTRRQTHKQYLHSVNNANKSYEEINLSATYLGRLYNGAILKHATTALLRCFDRSLCQTAFFDLSGCSTYGKISSSIYNGNFSTFIQNFLFS